MAALGTACTCEKDSKLQQMQLGDVVDFFKIMFLT